MISQALGCLRMATVLICISIWLFGWLGSALGAALPSALELAQANDNGTTISEGAATDNRATIVVPAPARGGLVRFQTQPGRLYKLDFPAAEARIRFEGATLVIQFDDGGKIVFLNFVTVAASSDPPLFEIDGKIIGGNILMGAQGEGEDQGEGEYLELAASITIELPSERNPLTVRGLLFGPGTEEPGYALYSYLLFTRDNQMGERWQRRRQAILAFLQGYIDIAKLSEEDKTAQPLNIFLAPVRAIGEVQSNSGRYSIDRLNTHLIYHYDFKVSLLILSRLKLDGSGPYIVSYRAPISTREALARVNREQMLIQNLGWVPPRLVRLWIEEFRQQAARTRFWDQKNFRQFGLRMRTTIAAVADSYEITKAAAADLIEVPQ